MIRLYFILWLTGNCIPEFSTTRLDAGNPQYQCDTEPTIKVEVTFNRDSAITHLADGHGVYQIGCTSFLCGKEKGKWWHVYRLKRRPAYVTDEVKVDIAK